MKKYYGFICLILFILLIFVISIIIISIMRNNNKEITFFANSNNKNNGCLSLAIQEFPDATYSFDGGHSWQQNNYGVIYHNGEVSVLAKNSEDKVIFQKKLMINSIIDDAPIIEMDFDKKISSLDNNKLLNGVKASYNNQNISNDIEINALNSDEKSALVTYFVNKNDKQCFIMRKVYIDKDSEDNSDKWVWPIDLPYSISSPYGWRSGNFHSGVDIYGPGRGSLIYAARSGEIVNINYSSSMGYYVTIKHDNGYYTQYLHMQNINGNDYAGSIGSATKYISVGQRIEAHTVIGEMGSSGVHLHFEIWGGVPYQSKSYDPFLFY